MKYNLIINGFAFGAVVLNTAPIKGDFLFLVDKQYIIEKRVFLVESEIIDLHIKEYNEK